MRLPLPKVTSLLCIFLQLILSLGSLPGRAVSAENGSSDPSSLEYQVARNVATILDTGRNLTCALTTTGKVICWGGNSYGALGGDPTVLGATGPVTVTGMTSGIQSISTGYDHSCAITAEGGVKCWGANGYGQLGNGKADNFSYPTPVQVIGLTSGIRMVATGTNHTCALTETGGVKCWGYNYHGQLGDGTGINRRTPTEVLGLSSGAITVTASDDNTCVVLVSGAVKCWGYRFQNKPTDIPEWASGVVSIRSTNEFECALMNNGGVQCRGRNYYGQLGNGNTVDSSTPVNVVGLSSGVQAISAGGGHSCALTTSGAVKCWGYNQYGQIGNDSTEKLITTPKNVIGMESNVIAISADSLTTCALKQNREVWCWGQNDLGQLGDGTMMYRTTPADVVTLATNTAAISAGGWSACALTKTGGAKCWGENQWGELGDGTQIQRTSPIDVVGLTTGVQSITTAVDHACAVTDTGSVKCWGNNNSGQLGDGTIVNRIMPTNVSGLTSGTVSVVTRSQHNCAITTEGGLKCWGNNSSGQLGDGTTTNRLIPTDVVGLSSGVEAVALGWYHTCALLTGGALKCWGSNNGKLGDGTTTQRLTPTDVVGFSSGAVAVTAGNVHTCAVTSGGGAKCWGTNNEGQFGNGTKTDSLIPVDVKGLTSGVAAISAGYWNTCALTASGGVKCWGENEYGQLGDGTISDRLEPVNVLGLSSGVVSISAASGQTCAVTADGTAKCWGMNDRGQLGDGRLPLSRKPSRVLWLDPLPEVAISGTVSDSAGPLAGVTITLSNISGSLQQKTTGIDGSFLFGNLFPGVYTLTVQKQNYVFTPPSIEVNVSDADITGRNFTGVIRPASISGALSLPGGDHTGVTVSLFRGAELLTSQGTGAEGTFLFEGVEAGTYLLVPFRQNYVFTPASEEITLTGLDVSGLQFVGDFARASVSGTITSGSIPLEGVTVSLRDATTNIVREEITGEDGSFIFKDLEAGSYSIKPSKESFRFTPTTREILIFGSETTGIDFSGEYLGFFYLPIITN